MAGWTIETEPEFDRFFRKLSDYKQAVLTAAIERVLAEYGIDICRTEWGKNLGQGLFEFRVRRSLQTIINEYPVDDDGLEQPPDAGREVLLRVFCTFHGDRIVLLLHGYDKERDPSTRRQQREIDRARKILARWGRLTT